MGFMTERMQNCAVGCGMKLAPVCLLECRHAGDEHEIQNADSKELLYIALIFAWQGSKWSTVR